jgi:hypothetical protein
MADPAKSLCRTGHHHYHLNATPMFARLKSRPDRTLLASGLPESNLSSLKPG